MICSTRQGERGARSLRRCCAKYEPYPGCVDRILQPVTAAGGRAWIDLVSSDEVLLSPATPAAPRAHFEGSWAPAGPIGTSGYQRYLRPPSERLPGRVSGRRRTRAEVAVTMA